MAALLFDDLPDAGPPGGSDPIDPTQTTAAPPPSARAAGPVSFDDIPNAIPDATRPIGRDSAATADATPAPNAWDQQSYLSQSGNQIASGWESVKQGFNTIGAGTSAQTLRDMDAIDAGQMPTNLANVEYYSQADPATRAQLRAGQENEFGQQLGNIVSSQQYQSTLPSNPRAAALRDQVNSGDYSGAWRTFRSDPFGIVNQGVMQSLPAAAPAIAGGLLGPVTGLGTVASMAGTALGSYASQVGPRALQYLDENLRAMGVDTSDPNAMARAIIARPQVVRDAFARGGVAALGPAFIDGITMGLTRGVIAGAGVVNNAGRIAGDFALGAAAAPAGEASAQYLGEGRINDPGAVAQAAATGLPLAAARAGIATLNARQGGVPLNLQPGEQPPQIAGPPSEPQGPAPALPPPPGTPVPTTGEPPPVPVVQPAVAAPGEQVFHPGTMTAPRTVQQIMVDTPMPFADALAKAAEEREAFAGHWGPQVFQTMVDAKPLPRSADAIMAADPSVGAPQATRIAAAERQAYEAETGIPQPRGPQAQRGEVEAFLNDPRSNDEIQAEIEAPLRQAVQTTQQSLPPGFTFVRDGDTWDLTSPSGDVTSISSKPLPTPEESASAAALADHLNKNIDYSKYLRIGDGTPENPIKPLQASDMPAAAAQVETPTPAQAQAGNYKMGHVDIGGLQISIETPAGETRSGTAPDGTPWSVQSPYDYGYVKRTSGADGDHVDIALGPRAHDAASLPVYVIDQKVTPGWEFDEHKVFAGYPSMQAAKIAYWQGFSDGLGPQRMGAISELTFDQFRKWLKTGDTKAPLAYRPPPIPAAEKQRAIYNRPLSLLEFLGASGGVKDEGGELEALGLTNKFLPKIGRLVRKTGMSLDYAREAAQEAGYLPKESANSPSTIGIADLLDAMDREARGTKVFRPGDEAEMFAAAQTAREATDEERLQVAMGDVQMLAEELGMRLTRAETEEAATAVLGGADLATALVEAAERAAVEADAAAAAAAPPGDPDGFDIPWNWKESPDHVEQQGAGQFPGDAIASAGGEAARPTGPPAVEPAPHSEQPAGGDGHVSAAHPGDQKLPDNGQRKPSEPLLPGFREPTERERAELGASKPALQGGTERPDHGLFSPATGNQTDLVDAVRAETGYGSIAAPNIVAIAGAFRDHFATGGFQTIVQARQFAGRLIGTPPLPGTHAAKLVDEAIELGVVLRARQIVQSGLDQKAAFEQLVDLYGKQPNLGVRTSESVERQAYSTPVPLAFLASRLAQINGLTTVFEPTAGNGALLLEADPTKTSANELDPERAVSLAAQGFTPTQFDAVKIPALANQFDRVIANPPFGAVKGDDGKTVIYPMDWIQPGYHTGEIDHAIALTSLATLKDDGRAVLILGGLNKLLRTPQARAKGYFGKAKREFFLTLYGRYNVVDHFTVPGELYERQGAGWPVDVIVIQGRGKSALPLPAVAAPRIEGSWPALGELLNGTVANGSVGSAGQSDGQLRPDIGAPAAPHVPNIPGAALPAGSPPNGTGGGSSGGGGTAGVRAGTAGGVVRPSAGQPAAPGGPGTAGGQPGVSRPVRDSGDAAGSAAVASAPDAGSAGSLAGDEPGRLDEPSPAGAVGQGVAEDLAAPPPDLEDRAPEKKRDPEAPAPSQVPYAPRSKMTPVGTLVPLNLHTASQEALSELMRGQSNTGHTIDQFVAQKLGYTMDELEQYFSAEQVDAIALGIANVDKGQGFVIGDQTGVGKGRFVAAMIRYADRAGHTPIFVTEKPNLFADMARDLTDIGMADFIDKIVPTNTSLNLPLTDDKDGQRFKTPGAQVHNRAIEEMARNRALPPGKRALFTTYAQQQQQAKTDTARMRLLRALAPNAFVILDESHNAGGVGGEAGKPKTMKSGRVKMPRSAFFREITQAAHSVVFSSATWAKRPDTIDLYAAKTDMRKAVDNIDQLSDAIKKGGVPMQQIVSAGLVQVGQYVRRERSFDGVTYDIQSVPVDHATYDRFASLLADIFRLSEEYAKPAIEEIGGELVESGSIVGSDGAIGSPALHTVGFSSIMHNIIEQMLLASKAKGAADLAIERFKAGEKPIITVANTMGAFIGDYAETIGAHVGDRMDLTFNQLVLNYLKRNLRFTIKPPFADEDTKAEVHWITPADLGLEGERFYHELDARIRSLDLSEFPASPIDYMRARMARAGMRIAEITGRTEAADYVGTTAENSHVTYRRRSGKETGITGRRETINGYNRGDVDGLILNQSGATGISLHASRTYKDQRKRVMIIAQAERNIDTHMQMLGRVHRTGQVRTPAYLQLVADVPAENRPAAVLQQKMASLSASTTSNRKSAVSAGNAPDFINRYGGLIVHSILANDLDLNTALGSPVDPEGDVENEKDPEVLIRRVTGRIPLLPLALQQSTYDRIESAYRLMIEELDAAGENALEAKTLELDARVLETAMLKEGVEGSTNPFEAAAVLQKMDVKRTVRPPKPHVIVHMLARQLDMDGTYTAEGMEEQTLDQLAAHVAALAKGAGKQMTQDALDELRRDHARAVSRAKALTNEDRRKPAEDAANGNHDRIRAVLQMAKPGTIVRIAVPGELFGPSALVLSVIRMGENANAPSTWRVMFLSADGLRRTIPGNQLYTAENAPQADGADTTRILQPSDKTPVDFLAHMKEEGQFGREERWLITGNILAGFAEQSGQIINFSDNEGAIRQGVMLARNFDATRFAAGRAQRFSSHQAISFLRTKQQLPPYIESTGGTVRVAATDDGRFLMTVPSSKEKGGRYFLSGAIRQAGNSSFVSAGSDMRMVFSPHSMPDVVSATGRVLNENQESWISQHPAAKAWAEGKPTPPPPSGGGIRESRASHSTMPSAAGLEMPKLKLGAFRALADTIHTMTGHRVTIEAVDQPIQSVGGGYASGLSLGGSLIVTSLNGSIETGWVLHHEAVHSLRHFDLIRPSEWSALTLAADMRGWAARYSIDTRYADLSPEGKQEEAIAESFADYMAHRQPAPKGVIGASVQRVGTFFGRVKSALGGNGFTRAEDVFERIATGKIGKRESGPNPGPEMSAEDARKHLDRYYINGDEPTRPFTELFIGDESGPRINLMAGMSDPLRKAIQEGAAKLAKKTGAALADHWKEERLPPGVRDLTPELKPDLGVVQRYLGRPTGWMPTELRHVFEEGLRAEEKESVWIRRVATDYERVKATATKAEADLAKVWQAMLYGDENGIDNHDPDAKAALFASHGLEPSEQRAFDGLHAILDKVARLVDQHRRAMMPKVQIQKAMVWEDLQHALDTVKGNTPDFRKLYRERAKLTRQVQEGAGDLDTASKRIDEINKELRALRSSDPTTQAKIAPLQDAYDALESRLSQAQVRGVIPGYVPHKFFGSWRVWVQEAAPADADIDEETGQQPTHVWRELTSDQGFYNNRREALRAIKAYKKIHPTAVLKFGPKQIRWPFGMEGTELSDASFRRLTAGLAEQAQVEGAALDELLEGVARLRARRRIYSSALHREGAEGFSRDMDRVFRAHIGQSVRYVTRDRLKYVYVSTMEKLRLSRNAVMTSERKNLIAAMEQWFQDINGGKQSMEEQIDASLQKMPVGRAVGVTALAGAALAGFASVAATGGGAPVPWAMGLVGSYAGYRMWQALGGRGIGDRIAKRSQGTATDFTSRSFVSKIVGDGAHLRLGMIANIHAAYVNLGMLASNAYPALGERWATVGMKRAAGALWDSTRGVETADTKLLDRADIRTNIRLGGDNPILAEHESRLRRASMFMFHGSETVNRATVFLGAYARAESEGMMPGPAFIAAQRATRENMHHYGNASKPELMRKQLARIPASGLNWMIQQSGWLWGLGRAAVKGGAKEKARLGRALLGQFLIAGWLGFPGVGIVAGVSHALSGFDPVEKVKELAIEAQALGNIPGNMAGILSHGLPGYLVDTTQSMGLADGPFPTSAGDVVGADLRRLGNVMKAIKEGYSLVDTMNTISPSFKWLKALETAANGFPITDADFWTADAFNEHTLTAPGNKDQTVYHPNKRQIVEQALGFTPIEQAQMQEAHGARFEAKADQAHSKDDYLRRINTLVREKRAGEVAAVMMEAKKAGILITQAQLVQEVRNALMPETTRDLKGAPKIQRPDVARQNKLIEERLGH
jgi:hypothetical protein